MKNLYKYESNGDIDDLIFESDEEKTVSEK